jgi:TIR domain
MDFDVERGLDAMRQLAPSTAWEQDFLLYEARMRANLREERRYGATEQTRSERARIVDQLNELARANLHMTFNELCMSDQRPAPTAVPTGGQRKIKPPRDSFAYDAFISFSEQDRNWVYGTLLPHLERAQVRVWLPDRDAAIGRPRLVNIEDAVAACRRTLLIMTPDWIADNWSAFETLLVQTSDPMGTRQRMLPIKVRDCTLPDRLNAFESLDLTDLSRFASQMERLIKAILAPNPVGA